MSTTTCPHDAAATHAAHTGTWTPALRVHVDTCPDCRQAVALVEQLAVLAATTAAIAPPSRSPHALWLCAELAQRARARRRTRRRQLVAAFATPALASIGFTLASGTEGWVHLGQSPAPVTLAAALGVAIAAWVMASPQPHRQS